MGTKDTHNYYELAYGLYFSRGLKYGDTKWAIDKKMFKNYLEFHLDRPCNPIKLSLVLGCFNFNGHYYYFPEKGRKLKKLNAFSESNNYKYSSSLAFSITETKLKDLQKLFKYLNSQPAQTYYVILYALLSTLKDGVALEGIQEFLEHNLGEKCDNKILVKVLEAFTQTSATSISDKKLYCIQDDAKALYLKRKLSNLQDQATTYKCSEEDAYRICYPKATKEIEAVYQEILENVDANGVKYFAEGIKSVFYRYDDVIGEKNIKKYIYNLTKKHFFMDDTTTEQLLVGGLKYALWASQEMAAVASVALRALRFQNHKGNADEYQPISNKECSEFVLGYDFYASKIKKHLFDKEDAINEYATSIRNWVIFSRSGRNYDAAYWMPDAEIDAYYTDAVCNSFVRTIAQHLEADFPDNLNAVCEMIWGHIELSDEERQKRIDAKREREETQERCANCIYKNSCTASAQMRPGRCEGYTPKKKRT